MATNTTNYNFKKPDESDFYSVQDQNNNWDKADAALKDLDTPTFEDYSGSTTVPDAATAINSIRSKGKLSTILSNMKAAFKGACLIGQIVNNCVTNNAKLPLSAAQGKALMDLYTQLNSDLSAKEFAFATNPDGVSNANIKCIQIGKLCVVNGTFRPRIAGTPLLLGSFAIMPKYGGYYPITAFDKVASFGTLSADGKFNCNIPTTLINEDCVVNFFYIVD